MGRDDYLAVLQTSRLADGTFWPLPITLDVPRGAIAQSGSSNQAALLDQELYPVALLKVGENWQVNLAQEVRILYGSDDTRRPNVRTLLRKTTPFYLSGTLLGLRPPVYHDRVQLYPQALREQLRAAPDSSCLAVFVDQPMTRQGVSAVTKTLRSIQANHLLLLQIQSESRKFSPKLAAQCMEATIPYLEVVATVHAVDLSPWPYGEDVRSFMLRAIICQNYGATHLLIGKRQRQSLQALAGTSKSKEQFDAWSDELTVEIIEDEDWGSFSDGKDNHFSSHAGLDTHEQSSQETYLPEVWDALQRYNTTSPGKGFTLFITGLSGSGKSTLAHLLAKRIEGEFNRKVSVLDGDYSRELLTSDLSATREDKWRNVVRHAWVASQINRHGGIAICALVAPDAAARHEARAMVAPCGAFIEIYIKVPVEVCEARDQKSLYARARGGVIKGLPGLDEKYDEPAQPEVILEADKYGPSDLAQQVMDFLKARSYL